MRKRRRLRRHSCSVGGGGKGREGEGREGKGREGKGREGKGREGKGKGRRDKFDQKDPKRPWEDAL